MTLDPKDRRSWQGFIDLLTPPPGYRLKSALGTTFGMSMDALTAAMLAMSDADGESLNENPVAGVIAATKLRDKVRILVHPGTISSGPTGLDRRFLALLDRMILEIPQNPGLFHPKVWALRFGKIGRPEGQDSEDIGRLIVCSRNLSSSNCFEASCHVEGTIAARNQPPSRFSGEVGQALESWIGSHRLPAPVKALLGFLRNLKLEVPTEAADEFRFRWQRARKSGLSVLLPSKLNRAVIVSPFLSASFVDHLASRTKRLQIISSQEALDGLNEETFAKLKSLVEAQGEVAAYQITQLAHTTNPEGGSIDGLHAKLLLIEDSQGRTATYVGSANATDSGWGRPKAHNVEAVAELRPGLGIDRFLGWFVRPSKTQIHPWIMEYDRSLRSESDPAHEAERKLLSALREVATLKLILRYEPDRQRLILANASEQSLFPRSQALLGIEFSFRPLLIPDTPDHWCKPDDLAHQGCIFNEVSLDQVSKFVVIRAKSQNPRLEKTRWVMAHLKQAEETLDRRDELLRETIMSTVDPAAVLNALFFGLANLPSNSASNSPSAHGTASMKHLLGKTPLERLLETVAREPGTIREIRMLLGSVGGAGLKQFCDVLEQVITESHSDISA